MRAGPEAPRDGMEKRIARGVPVALLRRSRRGAGAPVWPSWRWSRPPARPGRGHPGRRPRLRRRRLPVRSTWCCPRPPTPASTTTPSTTPYAFAGWACPSRSCAAVSSAKRRGGGRARPASGGGRAAAAGWRRWARVLRPEGAGGARRGRRRGRQETRGRRRGRRQGRRRGAGLSWWPAPRRTRPPRDTRLREIFGSQRAAGAHPAAPAALSRPLCSTTGWTTGGHDGYADDLGQDGVELVQGVVLDLDVAPGRRPPGPAAPACPAPAPAADQVARGG